MIWIESDRRAAIRLALRLARAGDLVLIAGKGHEDYQIIGSKRIHFDDREVAREELKKLFQGIRGMGVIDQNRNVEIVLDALQPPRDRCQSRDPLGNRRYRQPDGKAHPHSPYDIFKIGLPDQTRRKFEIRNSKFEMKERAIG